MARTLKGMLFGYKQYCVFANHPDGECLEKCFPTKEDAKNYMKTACSCFIEKQARRGTPFGSALEPKKRGPPG